MRVLLLSDPHYDFHHGESRAFFLQALPQEPDAIVVAGDVSNTAHMAEEFFSLFNGRFESAKRYYVLGNHCAWIGPHARTNLGGEPCVHEIARRHGFHTTGENELWRVMDGVLLFDLFYRPGMTADQIAYTVDDEYMDVRARQASVDAALDQAERPAVTFSVSHLSPNTRLPTQYKTREPMFYNEDIDRVLRAHASPVHFFGHTHERVDTMLDGVRYLNSPIGYECPRVSLSNFVAAV
jgi:3',5'-cyclic AMP phosphodiesterase CpdA